MATDPQPGVYKPDVGRRDVSELVRQLGAELDTGRIPLEIFNDEDVYNAELARIFAETWVFVGHESEVEHPGDYARRYIGEDPFIFVRDESGEINVLFDGCRHRGTKICRAEQGNTSHFRCPYHGWTYKNNGELVGVPHIEAYDDIDKSELGLLPAPTVDSYEGFVFASLSADVPPLEEYLGEFKWYMDLHLKLSQGGMEVVAEPHRWEIDTNWKIGAENFAGDDYHVTTTHKSALDSGIVSDFKRSYQGGESKSGADERFHIHCDGHATGMALLGESASPFFGYPESVQEHFTPDRLSDEQFEIARRSLTHVGTVFPNFSFIHWSTKNDPDRESLGYFSIRQWQPRGPDTLELWSWVLLPAEASTEYKRRAYEVAVGTFSPSGNYEQDDLAVWDGIATAAGSQFVRKHDVSLDYTMGGAEDKHRAQDWPGPGDAYDTHLEDGYARTLHRKWFEMMDRGEEEVDGE